MSDKAAVLMWVHSQNIQRYARLLETELTAHERRFIETRLVEEKEGLRRARAALPSGAASQASAWSGCLSSPSPIEGAMPCLIPPR